MKTAAVLGMFVASATLAGCSSLSEFDIDLPASGEIPGQSSHLTGAQFTGYDDAPSTISQTMANKGVKSGDFKSATITAGSVSVAAASAQYMAYIQSFTITVSSPGLPTVTIAQASMSAFAAKTATVAFTLPSVELKPYLVASSVTFTATPVFGGADPPFASVPLNVDLTLHIQIF